jgi:hypothetical protein
MIRKPYTLSPLIAAFFISGLLLAGCTTVNPVRVVPAVGMPRYSPTNQATVVILREEPSRLHEILGQIIIEPQDIMAVPDMELMMRRAAAGMGADAAVIIAGFAAEANRAEIFPGQVVYAIAIRYKKQASQSDVMRRPGHD